ncbi:hypothetical protein D3C86_1873030 [compost metagenome]
MVGGAKLLPVGIGEIGDQVVADLLQQGGFAVAPGLLQQFDQGLFQLMIARRQRDDEQLWIEVN